MNVLVLEDRGSVSFYLEEGIRSRGHTVFSAFTIPDARSYWENEQIDCIVVDSNMSPDGLGEEQIKRTKDGLLTGVIWLLDSVFPERQDMRERTIIYTDYLERLRESFTDEELRGLQLFSKKGSVSPAREFLKSLDVMAAAIGREK